MAMSEHMESPSDLPAMLTFYETAKMALAEARTVDETKKIRNKAERMAFAARQAKDRDLIADATEIQSRAERRLGELLLEAKRTGQLHKGGRPSKKAEAAATAAAEQVSLEEAGISWKLSSKAQKLAEFPADQFESVLKSNREKIKSGAAVVVNPTRDLNTQDKQIRRAIKEHELASRQKDLPAEIFGLIMEDPEWQFDTWSELGKDRAADNHYPTSTLEAIKARPVGKLAADDSVYFLWATVPMLPQALELMAARGFVYKTHFIWDKIVAGTGYWNRNRHELLLVGVRGNVPAPAMGTQWESLIAAPKAVHSAKPDWAYELCEHYYPNLKKIELNARRLRSGWTAWGLEAPEEEVSAETNLTAEQARPSDLRTSDPQWSDGAARQDAHSDGLANATRQGEPADAAVDGPQPFDGGPEYPSGESGTAREAPGSTAPSDGIAGLSGDQDHSGGVAARPVDPVPPQDGTQSAPPPLPSGLSSGPDQPPVAATPETDGGALPAVVPGAGEGDEKLALPLSGSGPGQPLPHSQVAGDALTREQKNDIIRACYALEPFPGGAFIAERTGLSTDAVKQRARTMKLGSRARQQEAARRLIEQINEARAGA
jgi:N6-adenosine-specific RNA methylase IME4